MQVRYEPQACEWCTFFGLLCGIWLVSQTDCVNQVKDNAEYKWNEERDTENEQRGKPKHYIK
jgi:hypothetical protein